MSLEFKGTTVKITSSVDALNKALRQADMKMFLIRYEARKKDIQKRWNERKQRMKGIKQSSYDVIHKHVSE